MTAVYDAHLRPAGIRSTQLTLLATIDLTQPVPVQALAEQMMMDRTTLTRGLAVLAKNGWVAMSPDRKDKRVRLIELTGEGVLALREAYPLWQQAQAEITTALHESEGETARRLNAAAAVLRHVSSNDK